MPRGGRAAPRGRLGDPDGALGRGAKIPKDNREILSCFGANGRHEHVGRRGVAMHDVLRMNITDGIQQLAACQLHTVASPTLEPEKPAFDSKRNVLLVGGEDHLHIKGRPRQQWDNATVPL